MLSDAKLLIKLRRGDEASFEALFLRHYDRVCGVLFRLLGDKAEAEDIAQQTFLKLYRCPEQVKGQEDELNVVGWLYRVALNEGYNALRSRKRRTARQENFIRKWLFNTSSPDPAEAVEQRDAQGRVRQILAGMKPRQARLLLLRHAGLSYKELAAVLDVAPGSVGSLLTRAERAFARQYRQVFGEKE
jgi:RNA polymerase sigma-70 factor (ECF subfamily)